MRGDVLPSLTTKNCYAPPQVCFRTILGPLDSLFAGNRRTTFGHPVGLRGALQSIMTEPFKAQLGHNRCKVLVAFLCAHFGRLLGHPSPSPWRFLGVTKGHLCAAGGPTGASETALEGPPVRPNVWQRLRYKVTSKPMPALHIESWFWGALGPPTMGHRRASASWKGVAHTIELHSQCTATFFTIKP